MGAVTTTRAPGLPQVLRFPRKNVSLLRMGLLGRAVSPAPTLAPGAHLCLPYRPAPGVHLHLPYRPAPGAHLSLPYRPAPGAHLRLPYRPAPGAHLCLPLQTSTRGRSVSPETGAPGYCHVSSQPAPRPLTPKGHLPVGVEHDVHEECGNSGQRVGVQAGDTEPVAGAGQWVDNRSLDCENTRTGCRGQ